MEVLRRAKPRAFRPRKCSESRSSNGRRAFLIAGSGKPRRGHDKHCPEARSYDGATKNKRTREGPSRPQKLRRAPTHRKARAREEPSPGPPASETDTRPPKLRRGRGQEVLTRKRACLARAEACPNLGSSSKTDVETREAQSARQGGTEPGTTRFKDGRATTGPPAPRRGPGAPTVQPRPRGPDLESAQV